MTGGALRSEWPRPDVAGIYLMLSRLPGRTPEQRRNDRYRAALNGSHRWARRPGPRVRSRDPESGRPPRVVGP